MTDQPPIPTYRSFRLSVLIARYPVRIAIWLALMLLFTPDLSRFFYGELHGQTWSSRASIWAYSLGIFFILPFMVEFINYKTCPVLFDKQGLIVPGEFFLREKMQIPYRQLGQVSVYSSTAQRANRLVSVRFQLDTIKKKNRGLSFTVEDIPRKSALIRHLNSMGMITEH